MADRIAIMNDGVLQQVGLPVDVYQYPVNLFVAQFVGSPIMNVANGAIRPGDGCTNVVLGADDAVQRFPVELLHRKWPTGAAAKTSSPSAFVRRRCWWRASPPTAISRRTRTSSSG